MMDDVIPFFENPSPPHGRGVFLCRLFFLSEHPIFLILLSGIGPFSKMTADEQRSDDHVDVTPSRAPRPPGNMPIRKVF